MTRQTKEKFEVLGLIAFVAIVFASLLALTGGIVMTVYQEKQIEAIRTQQIELYDERIELQIH